MEGIKNKAFRSIVKEFGAGLVYSEMVSDKAICFKNEKTLGMLGVDEHEHPMSMQVFGGDKDSIVQAAKFIAENTACDIIDINMGCPVNKVLKADAGSKLLLYPDKIYEIVKAVVENVSKPVTVKIRAGFDSDHINAVEVAKLIEKAGASEINALGEDFDPNFHNAVMMEDSTEYESGKVTAVLQKGYILNSKVIRPSMVKVAN